MSSFVARMVQSQARWQTNGGEWDELARTARSSWRVLVAERAILYSTHVYLMFGVCARTFIGCVREWVLGKQLGFAQLMCDKCEFAFGFSMRDVCESALRSSLYIVCWFEWTENGYGFDMCVCVCVIAADVNCGANTKQSSFFLRERMRTASSRKTTFFLGNHSRMRN